MRIFLLRHGETDWNREGRLQGHTDIPMNENGTRQIREAGEYLLKEGESVNVIITSPLDRARMSAEIIADQIGYKKEEIIIAEDFIERSFGEAEGLTIQERRMKYHGRDYPGMETVKELCERAGSAMTKYIDKYTAGNILIVAHGAILKAVLAATSGGSMAYEDASLLIEPGSICMLEYEEGVFIRLNRTYKVSYIHPNTY